MKKQILTLMVSTVILSTSPAFAMNQETSEKESIIIPKKTPAPFKIDFTHETSAVGTTGYCEQRLKWLTGYEDSQTKEEKALFILNQKHYPQEPVSLELYNASLVQLKEILPLCANAIKLIRNNSTYRKDIWPNNSFLEAIASSETLSNLEYLYIQEHEKIENLGAIAIMNSSNSLPKLNHIHCMAGDTSGFYDVDKGPKFYWNLSQNRPEIKLTYAASYKTYIWTAVPWWLAKQKSAAVQGQLAGK